MGNNGRTAGDLPADWNENQRREYERYLDYQITSDEQPTLKQVSRVRPAALRRRGRRGSHATIAWVK